MQQGEIERLAVDVLRACGLPDDEPPDVRDLARGLLGTTIAAVPKHALPSDGALVRIGSAWQVFLRIGIAPLHARFIAAHEVAHHVLAGSDARGERLERLCDALAAAMLCPRPWVERAPGAAALDIASLADDAVVSDTCAALRIGEVRPVSVAVVGPGVVRARGPAREGWHDPRELRTLAKRGGPGVRRVSLRELRRVAVAAVE